MADEVVFFTGVPDKFDFACRLVRKKYREGVRLAVYAPPGLLSRLDQALWAEPERDFLPHVRLKPGAAVPGDAVLTRVWLLEQPEPGLRCDNALNLGIDAIDGLLQHARVAEVVGLDDDDRAAGQVRWKRYKAIGAPITHRAHGQR